MIAAIVQRQTLRPCVLSGPYSGSMSGSITGCGDPSANDAPFRGRFGLTVTQDADASASLMFTFVDANHSGIVCTLSGPLTRFGRLFLRGAQRQQLTARAWRRRADTLAKIHRVRGGGNGG